MDYELSLFFFIPNKRRRKQVLFSLVPAEQGVSVSVYIFFCVNGCLSWSYHYVNEPSSPLCTGPVNVRRILKRSGVCIYTCVRKSHSGRDLGL